MKHKLFSIVLLLTLILAASPFGLLQIERAHSSNLVGAIVEIESEPVISHQLKIVKRSRSLDLDTDEARAYEARLADEQQEFISRASRVVSDLRVVTRLDKLVNAVSIEAPEAELGRIAEMPGVLRVHRNEQVQALLNASIPLTGAPVFWDKVGGAPAAGEGVKIAIIDSGIDITNPLFSDAGLIAPTGFPRGDPAFTNNKVIVAKSFVRSTPSPGDENGHGTSVAGIAAGSLSTPSPAGPVSGVAPRAFIGNYRVLDREGRGSDDQVVRALEEAIVDGFDVACISLGRPSAGLEFDLLARAAESAVASGLTLAVAAGNSGDLGPATITSPGIAPSVITVGASTNAHVVDTMVSVIDPAPASLARIRAARGVGSLTSLINPLDPIQCLDVGSFDGGVGRACSSLPAGSLSTRVGLIERGDCTFANKVNAADAAGASSVVVFNRDKNEVPDGGDTLVLMSVEGTRIPSVFIGRSSGLALRDWVRSNPEARVLINPVGEFPIPTDVVAPFSSRGPTFSDIPKPDIVAPGTSIYSGAIKGENELGLADPSGFLAVSGTSQAAPHVAGAAALIKQLHPSWSPSQIKSALVSSAAETFADVGRSKAAGVLDAGAGRVDLSRAWAVSAYFSPASLSFGANKLKKKSLQIARELSITSLVEGQNDFAVSLQQVDPGEGVSVTTSAASVSLARGQTSTIVITISASKRAEKRSYSGFVVARDPQGQTLRVPFWVRFFKKR